jgi:outer membrane protein assembly factor BamE (lipoprotein component of BamABCDE complex)
MTLGVVQMSLHKGMSQSAVAEALGAPNIVTRDSNGIETWIYDKVASYASYKHSSIYGTILVLGGSSDSANTTTGQRTLTVIIKFDKNQKIKSFSYNSSKF